MSFLGVVLTILFVMGVFKLIRLYIEFKQAVRASARSGSDDSKTLGGLIILLMFLFLAVSPSHDSN